MHVKTNINPFWLAIPATCDFMASTLMFIALTMVDASIYQMMRGIIVVIAALLSIVFLGRKLYRHHWVAIVLIVGGVAEVGIIAILFPDDSEGASSSDNEVLGIMLLLLSQLFAGSMFIIEEKLLNQYYLDPFLIVGTEGMWGTLYYFILLPIMQYIHCEGDATLDKLCNYGYLENSAYAFAQMKDNAWIPVLSILTIFSIAFFNTFGIAVTKFASAAQRSTIDTSRTILIWFFSCVLGLEKFEWREIFGFIMLAFGTLMFNEIFVIPYFGFDTNTADKIKARKEETDTAGYMASSPQTYSTTRNQRLLNVKGSMAKR